MEFSGTSRFEILDKLGEGGMGIVYEAFDRSRNMRVALKTLRRTSATRLYRFKREFRALSELSHPNIIGLYDLHAEDGAWFLTMELVEGVDFVTFIRADRLIDDPQTQSGSTTNRSTTTDTRPSISAIGVRQLADIDADLGMPNPPAQRREIDAIVDLERLRDALAQLASALHALHSADIVHRDLKPSNVRVTPSGRVVLMDFGVIAETRLPESRDMAGVPVGTPAFMAPEQIAGVPATPAADWYALGVMMFQALTARRPYHGTAHTILAAKTQRDALAPSLFTIGIPDDLERLCLRLLSREPALRPSGKDVLASLGVVGERRLSASAVSASTDVFVGRADELARLRATYAAVCAGDLRCAFVYGASGMGKTELIDRLLRELARRDTDAPLVLSGRCYERERLPYKAFDGAVDSLCHVLLDLDDDERDALIPPDAALLGSLFPVLRRVPGLDAAISLAGSSVAALRARAVQSLRALLRALSSRAPIALRIEDLQWADDESLELLRGLLEPPDGATDGARLLILATLRGADPRRDPRLTDVVEAADRGGQLCSIEVGSLSDAERDELIEALAASLAMERDRLRTYLHEAWRESAGSPMLITELARYTKEFADLEAPLSALQLEAVIWERYQRLPASAQRLAELLAVADEPIPLHVLADAGSLTRAERERAMHALRLNRFARVVKSGVNPWIDTSHDKIREAIRGEMSEIRTRVLHELLARALEAWDDAPPRVAASIAGHKAAAGERVDAARYLVAAAQAATEQLASARAAELYEEALTLLPAPAEGGSQPSAEIAALICRACVGLAECMRIVDRNDEALALLDRAQPIARDTDMIEELATIHHLRGNLYFPRGDLDGCMAEHELSLDYARRAGTARTEAQAHSGLGDAYYMRGSIRSACTHFDHCVQACRAAGLSGLISANLAMRGITRLYLNELDAALGYGRDAAALAAELSDQRAEVLARSGCVGLILLEMGQLDRARRELSRALAMARAGGLRRFEPNSLIPLARMAAVVGDRARGRALIEESLALCRETRFAFLGPMALGAKLLVTDDPGERAAVIAEATEVLRAGAASHNHLYFYRDAIDAALAAADWDAACGFADALEAYTAPEPLPWSDHFIARGRALASLGRDPGDAEARAQLGDLLAEGRRVGLHLAAAAIETALGRTLGPA